MINLTTEQALNNIFPNLPTVDTLHIIDALKAMTEVKVCLDHSERPVKPWGLINESTPSEIREYADELEKWESDLEKWKEATEKCALYNMKVDAEIYSLIKERAGLTRVPEKYQNKVFSFAWSKGHSEGEYEVYLILCDLVELFLD